MKKNILAICSLALVAGVSTAANVTYSGTSLLNIQGSTAVDLTAGKLGLLIIDIGNDGILGGTTIAGMTEPNSAGAGLDVGDTFGGDLVVKRFSSTVVTIPTSNSTMPGGWVWNLSATPVAGQAALAGTESRRWAIVWFETLTAAGSTGDAPSGSKFGVASASSWITPASEPATAQGRTFSLSPTGANPHTLNLQNGGTETVGDPANATFATDGTTLEVVPEPSGAALGLLAGAGLLLRRRRN